MVINHISLGNKLSFWEFISPINEFTAIYTVTIPKHKTI